MVVILYLAAAGGHHLLVVTQRFLATDLGGLPGCSRARSRPTSSANRHGRWTGRGRAGAGFDAEQAPPATCAARSFTQVTLAKAACASVLAEVRHHAAAGQGQAVTIPGGLVMSCPALSTPWRTSIGYLDESPG